MTEVQDANYTFRYQYIVRILLVCSSTSSQCESFCALIILLFVCNWLRTFCWYYVPCFDCNDKFCDKEMCANAFFVPYLWGALCNERKTNQSTKKRALLWQWLNLYIQRDCFSCVRIPIPYLILQTVRHHCKWTRSI